MARQVQMEIDINVITDKIKASQLDLQEMRAQLGLLQAKTGDLTLTEKAREAQLKQNIAYEKMYVAQLKQAQFQKQTATAATQGLTRAEMMANNGIKGLIASLRIMNPSLGAAATRIRSLGTAMSGLAGGPLGLVLTAFTTLTSYILPNLIKQNEDTKKSVDKLKDSYKSLYDRAKEYLDLMKSQEFDVAYNKERIAQLKEWISAEESLVTFNDSRKRQSERNIAVWKEELAVREQGLKMYEESLPKVKKKIEQVDYSLEDLHTAIDKDLWNALDNLDKRTKKAIDGNPMLAMIFSARKLEKHATEEEPAEDVKEITNNLREMSIVAGAVSGAIGDIGNAYSEMGGQSKALLSALATIQAATAIMSVWAAPTTIPDPFGTIYKVAQTVSVAATTAAQIAKINSTNIPNAKNSYGSSGGTNTASFPAMAMPVYRSTYGVNTSSVNTAAQAGRRDAWNSILAENSANNRVYIVESDIKKASERVSVFENGLTV